MNAAGNSVKAADVKNGIISCSAKVALPPSSNTWLADGDQTAYCQGAKAWITFSLKTYKDSTTTLNWKTIVVTNFVSSNPNTYDGPTINANFKFSSAQVSMLMTNDVQQSTKIVESGARSIAFNSGKQEDVPFDYQLLALAAVPLNGLSQQSLWAVRKAFDWAVTKKNFMVVMIRYLKILKQINCL